MPLLGTCPQFVFPHVNPHLSPYTPLHGCMIKHYAVFLKPIFFWDTLYVFEDFFAFCK